MNPVRDHLVATEEHKNSLITHTTPPSSGFKRIRNEIKILALSFLQSGSVNLD